MNRFTLTPISAAAWLVVCGGALAQPTPPADAASAPSAQTIVVTGLRRTIQKAEETKREADQVVDAINAEDIGKFPDRSLGEAMQRLPGVQISRNNGEANEVLIRGLPDLATTVNGNYIFTGNGRRLSVQDLPVQALAGVEVFKSGSPDQLEGGIAGLLNARLRAPFDFAGFTASGYVDLRRVDPRGNNEKTLNNGNIGGLVSNRWKTGAGEFGLLFDAALIKDDYSNPVQWQDAPDRVWVVRPDGTGRRLEDSELVNGRHVVPAAAPAGSRLGSLSHMGGVYAAGERTRPMAHAALQWKPSADLEVNSQLLYTSYRSKWEDTFIFTITGWAPNATGLTVGEDGPHCETKLGRICPILTATVPPIPNGVDPFTATSTQAHDTKTDTQYGSIGSTWRLGALTWVSDLSFVKSKFVDDRIIVDQSVQFPTVRLFTRDGDGHGGFTVTTPTSANPMQTPSSFILRGLFQSWDEREGKQFAWRNDLTYQLNQGWLKNLAGGVRLAQHDATNHSGEGGRDVPDPNNRQSPPAAFGPTFNHLVAGIDRNGGSFAAPDRNFLLDQRDRVRAYYGAPSGRLPEDPNRLFDQTERSAAVHGLVRFAGDLGSVDVRGAVGVRVIRTDRKLRGKNRFGDVITPFDISTSDTDVLPNVSAVVGWTDRLQSHFNVGKTIRRPDFAQLNPSISATPPTINRPGSASAGNPLLEPVESISTDATIEYYFQKNGYVQLAAFHRDVKGYLQTFQTREVIDGQQYDVNRPNNSGKGTLQGLEFGIQKFFDFLPEPWSGLGAQFNYTTIKGENQRRTTLNGSEFVDAGFPGVAKSSYNLALLWEKFGVTGRLALTHRGDYIEALNTGRFGFDNRVRASDWVDLSIGYELTKNVSIQFDALNLTKESYRSYQANGGLDYQPRDLRYGATAYSLGLRLKL
jgi:iron complex outermembrane recepter protein